MYCLTVAREAISVIATAGDLSKERLKAPSTTRGMSLLTRGIIGVAYNRSQAHTRGPERSPKAGLLWCSALGPRTANGSRIRGFTGGLAVGKPIATGFSVGLFEANGGRTR